MSRRLPPLSSLRAFEAAARHGSFKRAAEELGVTPTAISHQVRLLEDSLGQRLFDRRTRQVIVTPVGDQLFPALRDGFDRMSEAVGRVRSLGDRAEVVITATTAFAAHWLVPRLGDLRERHPDLMLSVLATDELVNLEAGKADLAIRLSRSPPPGGEAAPLFPELFAPVASPRLGISGAADLARAVLIHFDRHRPDPEAPGWPKWLALAGMDGPAAAPPLRFNEESHALQAAIAGQGVALMSLAIADEALRCGLLVPPFAPTLKGEVYYLVRGPARRRAPQIDAVCEWLVEQAASTRSDIGEPAG
ncbi:LysR substrate-binding domain-containing protein [Sphingosinicella terrae]|uniref:LysR substrate-binding domain-containing protein n=1 Tax=Sphingosinicella terrae TaxID=2172047 RepID=UPI000E0DF694|nr:LysR substrate-binding domain-containing protein [Sphingosinicella terrae]